MRLSTSPATTRRSRSAFGSSRGRAQAAPLQLHSSPARGHGWIPNQDRTRRRHCGPIRPPPCAPPPCSAPARPHAGGAMDEPLPAPVGATVEFVREASRRRPRQCRISHHARGRRLASPRALHRTHPPRARRRGQARSNGYSPSALSFLYRSDSCAPQCSIWRKCGLPPP